MVVRIVFLLLSSILFDICSIYGFKLSGIKLSFLKRSVTRTDFDGVPLSSFNHRYLPYEIYDRYKGQNVHANQVFKKVEVKRIKGEMKIRNISGSSITVSEIGIGGMNFGDQISEEQTFEVLDCAEELGINFIDTAEAYPAPFSEDLFGESEKIIGRWLKQRSSRRENFVLSTKVCGRADDITWSQRNDASTPGTQLSRKQILTAVDNQLSRLQTDYIDILHFHWPERYLPVFGCSEYQYEREYSDSIPIREQLEAVDHLLKVGKIRSFGLCYESPYGISQFSNCAQNYNLPRPISLQLPYNLLDRYYMERCMMEPTSPQHGNMGLLAGSPLAGGCLTGKYQDWKSSSLKSARLKKYPGFMNRYNSEHCRVAIDKYLEFAKKWEIPLELLALSFVLSRPFISSTLVGVSSAEQLRRNIVALNVPWIDEFDETIEEIFESNREPSLGCFSIRPSPRKPKKNDDEKEKNPFWFNDNDDYDRSENDDGDYGSSIEMMEKDEQEDSDDDGTESDNEEEEKDDPNEKRDGLCGEEDDSSPLEIDEDLELEQEMGLNPKLMPYSIPDVDLIPGLDKIVNFRME